MAGSKKARPHPKIGSTFQKDYKGKTHVLEVIQDQGKVKYRLAGKNYGSPSAAAKSLTNWEVNGWAFWGMDKDES